MSGRSDAFITHKPIAPRPAPLRMRGVTGWLRTHVFSSVGNIVGSFLALAIVLVALVPTLRFLLVDAVWSGDNRAACLTPGPTGALGACWPFIEAKFSQLVYGFYPAEERWRVNIFFALSAILLAPLLVPRAPFKAINAALFFLGLPIAGYFLLHGGQMDGFALNGLAQMTQGVAHVGALFERVMRMLQASGHPFWLDYFITAAILSALAALAGGWRVFAAALGFSLVLGLMFFLMRVDAEGLPVVETRLWGGLLVTLIVSVTGIVASIPVGILLALGRRSRMPLVRLASVAFIEFWRGVPLVTVLFFATYMLPLFLPGGMNFDGLMRVLIGIALFAGAYNAEVIRGGMKAIPRGQSEAASALGLSRARVMGLVVLPQALRHVIPSLVNSFIALFKDTTLVLIVSIFDFLGQLRAAFADPNWLTPTTLFTGFAFAGMVYFIFCFAMSRYSLFLEARLNPHRRDRGPA